MLEVFELFVEAYMRWKLNGCTFPFKHGPACTGHCMIQIGRVRTWLYLQVNFMKNSLLYISQI